MIDNISCSGSRKEDGVGLLPVEFYSERALPYLR